MPKSRTRKKKKPNKKNSQKEVRNYDGIEIIRKGKIVTIRNTMSEIEHANYLQQLKENRPKAYSEIKDLIDNVVENINRYDKLLILGGIASYGYMKMWTDKSDDGLAETTVEYCLSIALTTPNINKGKIPTPDVLNNIYSKLIKIRDIQSAVV